MEHRLDAGLALLTEALGADLISVVLFGSHARGTARADSDVDLLVVVAQPVPLPHVLRARVRDAMRAEVDLCLFTPEELRANLRMLAPVMSTLVLGARVLYDPAGVFAAAFDRFLVRLARSRRLYVEGQTTWDLAALAREHVASRASPSGPPTTT